MKIKVISFLITALTAVIIGGCGGGGGGSAASTATTVSGVVSKGPVTGATVVAYAITGGAKGAEVGRFTPTLAGGSYSINIGAYTGPVLLESTGGTYTDEATGTTLKPVGIVMRAFVENAAGVTTAAVTPLTEMAAVNILAAGTVTPASIKTENAKIAAVFGVTDIVGVLPANAGAAPGAASTAQINYGLALATVSQYMSAQVQPYTLGQAVAALGSATPAAQTLVDLAAARSAFISSARNLSGVTGNVTATSITLKLSTQGILTAPNTIGGVEVIINLPPGVSIVNTAGDASAAVAASGVAVTGSTTGANFVAGAPNTVKVIVVKQPVGFGIGEFATVTLAKTSGAVVTPAHFFISGFKAVNGGDVNPGATLTGLDSSFTATFL
jgi:hypothetical protein